MLKRRSKKIEYIVDKTFYDPNKKENIAIIHFINSKRKNIFAICFGYNQTSKEKPWRQIVSDYVSEYDAENDLSLMCDHLEETTHFQMKLF